ncbi:MAG: phosphotransferase [Acidimicrobiales bacterium]
MNAPGIPATIADVSAPWFTAVLRDSGAIGTDDAVVGFETEQIGQGIGIMGELFRASLRYDGAAGPASVIVKLPSPFEANRAQGLALGMYDAEVRFYADIAPRTAARLAGCHLARIEPGTADSVLVLEDLGHLRMVDQHTGLTADEASLAVRALADLHGSWMGRAEDTVVAWAPSVVHERIQGFAQMYSGLTEPFLANFADWLPTGGAAAAPVISAGYWDGMVALSAYPWTLVHLDYRCENLFFGTRGTADEVVIVDWQTIGRGPGSYDLAYLLGGSLPVEVRRAAERDLVAEYLGRLASDHGVQRDPEEFWTEYRLAHALGGPATVTLTGATFDLGNERGKQLIGTMAQRHFSAVVDLDSTALLPR